MYFSVHGGEIFSGRSISMLELLSGILFEHLFSDKLHELFGWILFDDNW